MSIDKRTSNKKENLPSGYDLKKKKILADTQAYQQSPI